MSGGWFVNTSSKICFASMNSRAYVAEIKAHAYVS